MSAYKQLGQAVGHTEIIDETVDEIIARMAANHTAKIPPVGSLHTAAVNARQFCAEASTPSLRQWYDQDIY